MAPPPSEAPGWDAIDKALHPIYQGQEPKHYGTLIGYQLGGSDPLRGISAYPRLEPVPHWHFITYGFSELFAKDSQDPEVSGYGFEPTFRLKSDQLTGEPPIWVMNFLQNIARYVFSSGNVFRSGQYMNLNGPICHDENTLIQSMAFIHDPELPETVESPNGRLEFLQVVGITNEEELALKQWSTRSVLELFKTPMPLLITDLGRSSLLAVPEIRARVEAGAAQEGSNTGSLYVKQVRWNHSSFWKQLTLVLGALETNEFLKILPGRLKFDRPLNLFGDQFKVRFLPDAKNSFAITGPELVIKINPSTAAEVVSVLNPTAGLYKFPSYRGFQIQVEKTPILDDSGKVISTLG